MTYRGLRSFGSSILIPEAVHRIPGGLWLYASCKRLPVAAHKAIGHASRMNLRLVTHGKREWAPPFSEGEWQGVLDRSSEALGVRVERVVVHLPSDPRRRRFNAVLLDESSHPRGFAKFTTNPLNAREVQAMELLRASHPTSFVYPQLLESCVVGEWSIRISTHLTPQSHGPAWLDPNHRRRIVGEIQAIVAEVAEAGEHPVHGDFGPWNVRRQRDGSIAVVDWEEMTSGPLAADDIWHSVNQSLIQGKSEDEAARDVVSASMLDAPDRIAAARFWLEQHRRPEPDEVEEGAQPRRHLGTVYRILAVMERMANA